MLVARRGNRLRGIAENAMRMGARYVMIMTADVVKEGHYRRFFLNEAIDVYGRGMFLLLPFTSWSIFHIA